MHMQYFKVSHRTCDALDCVESCTSNNIIRELLIETHCRMIEDHFNHDLAQFVCDAYNSFGLKRTVSDLSLWADTVLAKINEDAFDNVTSHDVVLALITVGTAATFGGEGEKFAHLIQVGAESHFESYLTVLLKHDLVEFIRRLLQILRFPKRFSYPSDKALKEQTMDGFLKRNRSHVCKGINRYLPELCLAIKGVCIETQYKYEVRTSWRVIDGRKFQMPNFRQTAQTGITEQEALKEMINIDPMRVKLDKYTSEIFAIAGDIWSYFAKEVIDIYNEVGPNYHFANGTSYEHATNTYEKMLELSQVFACFDVSDSSRGSYQIIGKGTHDIESYSASICRISCVPKDYRGYRVIAPEEVATNYLASRMQQALHVVFKRMENMVPYWDQVLQSDRMESGTTNHYFNGPGFCSIDLKGASDSIPYWHVVNVLSRTPEGAMLLKRLLTYRSSFLDLDGSTRLLNGIWLTSGNRITWDFESLWFLILCVAIIIYHKFWETGRIRIPRSIPSLVKQYKSIVSIYGDDIAVVSEYFDAIVTGLGQLDYTVNVQKSYSGLFAESCGKDYWAGYDVTSIYWPRRHLEVKPKATWKKSGNALVLQSLIALQHRLYDVAPGASRVVLDFILDKFPQMSYSVPGTNADDVWGYSLSKSWKYTKIGMPPKGLNPVKVLPDNDGEISPLRAAKRFPHWSPQTDLSPNVDTDEVDEVAIANIEMYLYYRWLQTRSSRYSGDSDMPCYTWINGTRCSSCIENPVTRELLEGETDTVMVLRYV